MSPAPRTNQAWLSDLRGDPLARDRALQDLRVILIRGLKGAFRGRLTREDREFSELFEDFANEALVKVIGSLTTFQGLSQFTTWAHKICIRIAFAELRRLRWKDVSLESLVEAGSAETMADPRSGTGHDEAQVMAWLRRAMDEELTLRQRTALEAIAFGGMTGTEVARRMDTNRNALYKMLHDARVKLKARMVRDGMNREVLT